MESRTHEPRHYNNRFSTLDEVDSTGAATNSTLYVANPHGTDPRLKTTALGKSTKQPKIFFGVLSVSGNNLIIVNFCNL